MTAAEDIDQILEVARERAQAQALFYDGAVLPAEARAIVTQRPQARIVDVRSRAELEFVGRIPGSIEIEWKTYPGMKPNPDFMRQLEAQTSKEQLLFFICRSGGRSHEAAHAAKELGYTAYNILEGFEGERDAQGHRNTVGGWRTAGLPWRQG